MDVLLTGAAGNVGTTVREQLADREEYTFTYLDWEEIDEGPRDAETVTADIADYDAIRPAFEGQDAVIHLAAEGGAGEWPDILRNNVRGYYNVIEAARVAGVGSVIFASSNSVVGMHEHDHRPELYEPGYELVLDNTSPTRPTHRQAVSKVFGEQMGRYYVESHEYPRQFYALRIGSHRSPDDHPYTDAEDEVEAGNIERGGPEYRQSVARLKTTWISQRDFGQLIHCCLQDDSVAFDVFYGVSDNRDRWMSLENARARLGYRPVDDGAEWDGPPS